MNGGGVDAALLQGLGHAVHIALAVAEHDGVLDVLAADQLGQRLALLTAAAGHQALGDVGIGGGGAGHFDAGRGLHEIVGQVLDFRRHGGREQHRLPCERDQLADALDVRDEAHVQHAVGFVDHQRLHAREHQLAALDVVKQAARRGDQHIDAAVDLLVLVAEGDAADQERHGELVILAVFLEIVRHLSGQFARRLKNERARHAGLGAALGQALDHRQGEGGSLAGARLGNAKHVAVSKRLGDGLRLDGRGLGIASFVDGFHQVGVKAEIVKGHEVSFLKGRSVRKWRSRWRRSEVRRDGRGPFPGTDRRTVQISAALRLRRANTGHRTQSDT